MTLDGVPLDEWLDAATHSDKHTGMVPAFNLRQADEESLVWQRIFPLPGCRSLAPLLICPEHLDFSCMVVMAEVWRPQLEDQQVVWLRLGYNQTWLNSLDDIGHTMDWIPDLQPLVFGKQDYLDCLECFNQIRLAKMADKTA